MKEQTELAGRKVTVSKQRTWVSFDAGENGYHEAGTFYFWCAYGKDEFGDWTCVGRAETRLSPADRYNRMYKEMMPSGRADDLHNSMESRAVYAALYRRLPSAKGIRAATYREVANWMASHKSDALYARPNWVCEDKPMIGVPKEIV